MLDFLGMADNYDERAVMRTDKDEYTIDTCSVTDSDKPYETGISHKRYNGGDWVIVELYQTEDLAKAGHKKWEKKMSAKELPKTLKDVSTATIANLCSLGSDKWRNYKIDEPTRT